MIKILRNKDFNITDFLVDNVEDVNELKNTNGCDAGSTAYIISTGETYIKKNNGDWVEEIEDNSINSENTNETNSVNLSEYYYDTITSEIIEIPDSTMAVIDIKGIFKKVPDFHITGDGHTAAGLFNGYSNLVEIGKITNDAIYDTTLMFGNCYNLKKIELSEFDASSVTDMTQMFVHCSALEELDLSNFKTQNLTTTRDMFFNCTSLKKLNISNFDFSNITNFDCMFGEVNIAGDFTVPNDCYILVKDSEAKEWFMNNFSNLTNVHYIGE